MKQYLITIDYELWGDGSGDVIKDVVEPTETILNIAEQNNCRITIFYEWLEFERIQEEWNKGNTMGYLSNPVVEVRKQLIRAIEKGHDVQLHIHPQWIHAEYRDKWLVDDNQSRLSDYSDITDYGLDWLVATGKRKIESILKPVKEDYICLAIRAGGYNADPGRKYINCLVDNGIFLESSVYTGGKEQALNRYDYSMVTNSNGFWHVDDDIRKEGNSNKLIEVPIMALPLYTFQKYIRWNKVMAALTNLSRAKKSFHNKIASQDTPKHGSGLKNKLFFFTKKEYQTWDFCVNSNRLQNRFVNLSNQLYLQGTRDIFTLTGHSKGLKNNPKGLSCFFSMVKSADDCSFIVFTDLYKQLFL